MEKTKNNMELKITFYNFEETKIILNELKQLNFEELKIDEKNSLTFVEIKDKNYLCFVSKLILNDAEQYGMRIFRNDYEKKVHIDIPLFIIDLIGNMEN